MPRWGKVGKQRIKDTGALTRKRMQTCDDEFVAAAQDFIRRQEKARRPWFVWLNTTHMHVYTHTKPRSVGQAGRWQSRYHDTMIDHDKNVGQMLDFLDKLGIAENTFVQYSTDNGPHRNTWPDAGTTPFRSEKNTNWEGAFRVPLLVRWPGKIKAGTISNEIVQHHDWMPTFLAMAGASDVIDKLKTRRCRSRTPSPSTRRWKRCPSRPAVATEAGAMTGRIHGMVTTMDSAGRLVIPLEIRREAGLKPDTPLDVRWRDGVIEIEPQPLAVKLEQRGRLVVAVPRGKSGSLTGGSVERTRRAVRRAR
jgi:AbrB family looped-hinge helix DNA binding protein